MGDEHAATIPIRGWRSGVVGFRTANRRGRLECKRSSGRRFWTGQTVWEHVIYGIDEVQATLLGLHFAKTRLLDDGGYRFLGGTDLMLP